MRGRNSVRDVSGWSVLKPAGILFFLVGTMDILIAWHPFGFGSPEWEFGTVTATFNGLPAPTIGLALITASAIGLKQSRLAKVLAVTLALLAVLVIGAALLYATNIPIALQSIPANSIARVGLKKAIMKTVGQAVIYPITLLWIASAAWRLGRSVQPSATAS